MSKRSHDRAGKPPAKARPHSCFLSHSHKNKEFADKLADVLARHGVDVWYSPRELVGGALWQQEIGKALTERCDWFLVVLSKSAEGSQWVRYETGYALDNPPFCHARITPLLLSTCNWRRISFALGSFQMIDFRRRFEAGCRELLQSWDIAYKPE